MQHNLRSNSPSNLSLFLKCTILSHDMAEGTPPPCGPPPREPRIAAQPARQRNANGRCGNARRFAMLTWKVLPWVVWVLMVSIGLPVVSAATKNPTCVTGCVAAFEYCEL